VDEASCAGQQIDGVYAATGIDAKNLPHAYRRRELALDPPPILGRKVRSPAPQEVRCERLALERQHVREPRRSELPQ